MHVPASRLLTRRRRSTRVAPPAAGATQAHRGRVAGARGVERRAANRRRIGRQQRRRRLRVTGAPPRAVARAWTSSWAAAARARALRRLCRAPPRRRARAAVAGDRIAASARRQRCVSHPTTARTSAVLTHGCHANTQAGDGAARAHSGARRSTGDSAATPSRLLRVFKVAILLVLIATAGVSAGLAYKNGAHAWSPVASRPAAARALLS